MSAFGLPSETLLLTLALGALLHAPSTTLAGASEDASEAVPTDGWVIPDSRPTNLVEEPGQAALRAQGYVFVDRNTGESLREVAPCEFEISYRNDAGRMRRVRSETTCLIKPEIEATVTESAGGEFVYRYVVRNGRDAKQGIWQIKLLLPNAEVVVAKTAPFGWHPSLQAPFRWEGWGGTSGRVVLWAPLMPDRLLRPIDPGEELGGFSVTSRYRPGPIAARFEGAARHSPSDQPLETHLSEQLEEALTQFHVRKGFVEIATTGPKVAR